MKKTIKSILVALASVVTIVSCTQENLLTGEGISVSTDNIDDKGNDLGLIYEIVDENSYAVHVKAAGEWIATAPNWIKLTQYSGSGDADVTVSVKENYATSKVIKCDVEKYKLKEGTEPVELEESAAKLEENEQLSDSMYVSIQHISFPRADKITFMQATESATVSVTQKGDEDCPSPITKISIKDFLALPGTDLVTKYQVEGKVTGISNEKYGNFYLEDEEGNRLLIYGLVTDTETAYVLSSLGISEGDHLVVVGTYTKYKSDIEIKNALYQSHEKSKIVAVDTDSKEMPVEGGVFDVLVSYSGDWFKFDIDADWISVVDQVITAEGMKLTFKVEANAAKNRTGVITYTSGKGELPGEGGEEEGEEGEEEAGESLSVTTTISQIGVAVDYFRKVSAVTSGKKYLIVAMDRHALAIGADKNFGYPASAEVEYVGDQVKQANTDNAFIIESVEGGYTIRQAVDGRYLYNSGTYNNFSVSASLSAAGGVWTISSDAEGRFTITNATTNRYMQYGQGTDTSFGVYEDQQGKAIPYLYELVEE